MIRIYFSNGGDGIVNIENHLQNTQLQQLALTPQMLQSLSILQMDSLNLYAYLLEQTMENPMIDIDFLELAERKRRIPKDRLRRDSHSFLDEAAWLAQPESIINDLKLQFSMGNPNEIEKRIGYYLIETLTPQGYLPQNILLEAKQCGVEEATLNEALRLVQQLEPAGVGARDLRECLLLQLEREKPLDCDALLIVSDYLRQLGRNQLPAIAKMTGFSLERVSNAAKRIRKLSPYPLNGTHPAQTQYIIPDVYVLQEENGLRLRLNLIAPEDIQIVPEYQNLMDRNGKDCVNHYLCDRASQAKWISKCLRQRNETILKCMKTLLSAQHDFFLYGKDSLVPYSRSRMAHTLELNESTIYRALKDKYIACQWGVFPAEYFFPQTMGKQTEGVLRQDVIAAMLALLSEEDPAAPLSDQKIASLLHAKGLTISRRTVTKYREQLEIPSSSLRRSYD